MSCAREVLLGKTLEAIDRWEHGWQFVFSGNARLTVECLWRLLCATHVEVTSEDEAGRFGQSRPVDVAEQIRVLLGQAVIEVKFDSVTNDLTICFDGHELQVVNNSSGHEAWTLTCGASIIVGRNGL